LDLRLFVKREDDGVVGWVHVQANDVTDLLDEQRIVREFEAFDNVGLEPKVRQIRPMVE